MSSLLRNSTLETVFRPFPNSILREVYYVVMSNFCSGRKILFRKDSEYTQAKAERRNWQPRTQRTPKGGPKGGRGGASKTLTRKHSTTYVLRQTISLINSLRDSENFSQVSPSETAFGGSLKLLKSGFQEIILSRFCFSVRFAPAPLALPRGQNRTLL